MNSMLILFYKTHTVQSVICLAAKVKHFYECNGALAMYRKKTTLQVHFIKNTFTVEDHCNLKLVQPCMQAFIHNCEILQKSANTINTISRLV